jgi:hydroxypyruvate isomerase
VVNGPVYAAEREDVAMRYAVNVSMLFTELPFLERFAAVRAAGFDAVEMWWPRGADLDAVAAAITDAGVDVALMNLDGGDLEAGQRGLLADPRRDQQVSESITVGLAFAQRIGARRVNALVGLAVDDEPPGDQLQRVAANLRRIADAAAARGIRVLIEAINTIENGPYLVATTADADQLRRTVDRPNVRLQYDAYHMQRMEGNLTATVERYLAVIDHIQIADCPGRNQPGTGEIAYPFLLGRLATLGYDGYVGLEYRAATSDTTGSFAWLPREQRAAR